MEEIWKDIKGFEGKYRVSNLGEVKSINYRHTGKEHILKQSLVKGYYQVCLSDRKSYKVHRLVAQAFIPNPDNLPQVNHKDEDKCNNYVINLEWCSPEYNVNYGTRNDRSSESLKGIEFTEERKKNISNSKKGKPSKLKGKQSPLKGIKRPPRSEEWCKKISSSLKGHKVSDETRIKMSASHTKNK